MPSLKQGIANLSIQIVNFGYFRFAIIMVNHYDWSVLFVSVAACSSGIVEASLRCVIFGCVPHIV